MPKQPEYGLTPRDIETVIDLSRYRYLKTSQIQRLHFPSRRMANRRLKVLVDHKYLRRFQVPTIVGQGSNEYIYALDRKGAELVSFHQGTSEDHLVPRARKKKLKDFLYIEHFLAINDFQIDLEQAAQKSEVKLNRFIPEYEGEKTEAGGLKKVITDTTPDLDNSGHRVMFTPDATFILEKKGKRLLFFLEIDRGTVKIKSQWYDDFLDKVIAYASYLKHQGYKRYGKDLNGFRVLVVTTSDKRVENFRHAVSGLGIKKMVWFTTFEQVSEKTIFKTIWKLADVEDDKLYGIA